MDSNYKLTQMYMPFYAACVSGLLGFIFFMFSFASPYWLESFGSVHSPFLHMGLWSSCFDRFVHPEDYHANVLTGCYWMFDRFFFKIGLWEWLNPYWLVAIQVIITMAFVVDCCCMMILLLYYLLYGQPAAESTLACGCKLFVGIALTISIITFGIKSEDRIWMPRPDQNHLSWAYGFAILASIFSYISSAFLYCVSYTDRAAQEEVEFYEAVDHHSTLLPGSRSLVGYRVGSGHSVLSARRSVLSGNQPSNIGGVLVKVPSAGSRPEQVVAIDSSLRQIIEPGQAGYAKSEPRFETLFRNPQASDGTRLLLPSDTQANIPGSVNFPSQPAYAFPQRYIQGSDGRKTAQAGSQIPYGNYPT